MLNLLEILERENSEIKKITKVRCVWKCMLTLYTKDIWFVCWRFSYENLRLTKHMSYTIIIDLWRLLYENFQKS